jgi:hypothetical protein
LTEAASFRDALSAFGAATKSKLSNRAVSGAPEDQLRAPLEKLIKDLADISGFPAGAVDMIGESSISDLATRPDYAVVAHRALVGFMEIKAPGKGADPRRFTDPRDKEQWKKLRSLPNLLYTDGNAFSLWRDGQIEGFIVYLEGDVETSGVSLAAPQKLLALISDFLRWTPISPRSPKQLAEVAARLCRLLRDEVVEQLSLGSIALTELAKDWRLLLFPQATNDEFADGYAQAVTFGLLVARAQDIPLRDGIDRAAQELRKTNSLIGTALRLLTDDSANQEVLKTSLGTLTRVLDVVDWPALSKGQSDAWLYFYEDFLEVYDNALRKRTGSYYTPPEVVASMVRLVDEALVSTDLFNCPGGFASTDVTVADPATGTGTFLLGVWRPPGPPRRPPANSPTSPAAGAIPGAPEPLPDLIDYDAASRRLRIGRGFIDSVPPAVWNYEVSGKHVLQQWFRYRRLDRTRPIIGDRRPPSPLDKFQPASWPADYTTELMNLIHVLGRLVALEPRQAALLDRILAAPLLDDATLREAGAFALPPGNGSPRGLTFPSSAIQLSPHN